MGTLIYSGYEWSCQVAGLPHESCVRTSVWMIPFHTQEALVYSAPLNVEVSKGLETTGETDAGLRRSWCTMG